MFGWRKIAYITISFWISSKSSLVILGSNIFLIATGVPFRRPLWITEKPPWPICSATSISLIEISRTPGTAGNLPDVVDTSLAPCVNEAKFALTISFFKDSICASSAPFYLFSSFNWFSKWVALALPVLAVVGLAIISLRGYSGWAEAKFIQSRSAGSCRWACAPRFISNDYCFPILLSLMSRRSNWSLRFPPAPPKLELPPLFPIFTLEDSARARKPPAGRSLLARAAFILPTPLLPLPELPMLPPKSVGITLCDAAALKPTLVYTAGTPPPLAK